MSDCKINIKMTNKEVEEYPSRDPRLAALLAVHLVSQVLDEAYVIASAATESGQPWRHTSMFKSFKIGRLSETDDEDESLEASKVDIDAVNENKMEHLANIVATSTPQKLAGDNRKSSPEPVFIGQGDEDSEMHQNELTKCTSMFLNHLFDMSDVERVIICDDSNLAPTDPEPNDLLTQAMTKIMESYINTALGMAYDQNSQLNDMIELPMETSSPEHSDYSFLADAGTVDFGNDISFYINDDVVNGDDRNFRTVLESSNIEKLHASKTEVNSNDVARLEHAYLTMNRDYDQCSEDDADPILQDPKGMTLQEVELLTANTSDDNVSISPDPEEEPEIKPSQLAATSAISAAASGSRKSTLVRRCRIHGARLFACLRGWWRRKTPGKCKEPRVPGSVRGIFCPLSPDARRRAASLLDHRLLRSPSPSRPVVWKFNTVNEALVNSSRWKDYSFDENPDGKGDF